MKCALCEDVVGFVKITRADHGKASACGGAGHHARNATPPMTVPRHECPRASRPRSTKTAGGTDAEKGMPPTIR